MCRLVCTFVGRMQENQNFFSLSRLSDKLKQNLDSQLQSVGTSDIEPLKDDEQVLHNLEQQAQSALQVSRSVELIIFSLNIQTFYRSLFPDLWPYFGQVGVARSYWFWPVRSPYHPSVRHTYLVHSLHAFLSPADFFSKSTFSKNSIRNTIRVSNSLDSDQTWHIVGPDLGPNCLQSLSADDN